jgi:hypothetical protein
MHFLGPWIKWVGRVLEEELKKVFSYLEGPKEYETKYSSED